MTAKYTTIFGQRARLSRDGDVDEVETDSGFYAVFATVRDFLGATVCGCIEDIVADEDSVLTIMYRDGRLWRSDDDDAVETYRETNIASAVYSHGCGAFAYRPEEYTETEDGHTYCYMYVREVL